MGLKKRLAYLLGAIAVVALAFPAFGFTVTGKGEIGRDGKATAELTFVSELSESDFRAKLDDYVEAYNNDSASKAGETDAVTITSVRKTSDGYVIEARTRRIDRVTVSSVMDVGPAADYAVEDSQDRGKLQRWMNGDLSITLNSVKGSEVMEKITIGRPRDRQYESSNYEIKAKTSDGQVMDDDDFFDELAKSKDSVRIASFVFVGIDGLTDVTIELPAKVQYYGGYAVEMIDGNTMKLDVGRINAKVATVETVSVEEINLILGWAVYDLGASRLVIAGAILAGIVVIGGLVAFCVYINRLGKTANDKENEQ